ncbi:MAG: hypothetical protein KF713_01330 [Turneriella sp.]|nr:hypothetical protein [Turneriella sp.]
MQKANENYIRGVLFPTDFTVASLAALRIYLERYAGTAMRLFLVHGYRAGDSIPELLFHSPTSIARALAGNDFAEACAVLKNRFGFITTLGCTVFSGKNQAAFENFIAGYGISEAIVVHGYESKRRDARSFGLEGFIRASDLQISQINAPEILRLNASDSVAGLFSSGAEGLKP